MPSVASDCAISTGISNHGMKLRRTNNLRSLRLTNIAMWPSRAGGAGKATGTGAALSVFAASLFAMSAFGASVVFDSVLAGSIFAVSSLAASAFAAGAVLS